MAYTATNPMGLTDKQRYGILCASLKTERSSFDSHYKDLARFVKPRRTRWFVQDRNRGDRRNSNIVDSTATLAHRTLQSGMHAGISSPARPWMRLSVSDPDLAKYRPVKEWLHTVTERMLDVFLKSNLYNTLPVMYGDVGLFGTAGLGMMEDVQSILRTESYPIGSFAMAVNSRGICDTFLREFEMTVFQLVETFCWDKRTNKIDWSNTTQTVKTLWDNANYQATVPITWITMSNINRDDSKTAAKFKKFSSCWFETGSSEGKFLRESGFNEFPIIAPRWDVTGEDTYGTDCPGMTALGAVKQLQAQTRAASQGLEKMVNPPLQAPTEMRQQLISSVPGAVSYPADGTGRQGIRPLYQVDLAFDKLEESQAQIREQISRCFYEDLFLMLAQSDRREITATEVEERHEEKLLALGPVLERLNDEALDPLVDRAYGIMDRAGLIPPAPEELHGVDLKVEYTSIMAQAQKLVGVVGLERFMGTAMQWATVFPEVRHKVASLQAVEDIGDNLGINPNLIVDDDDAQKSIAAEQKAIAQQQQAELAAKYAGSARDLSQSNTTGDNALAQLVNGVTQ